MFHVACFMLHVSCFINNGHSTPVLLLYMASSASLRQLLTAGGPARIPISAPDDPSRQLLLGGGQPRHRGRLLKNVMLLH